MGFGSSVDLQFDTDEFRSIAEEYANSAEELLTLNKELDACLATLKTKWTTEAGKEFAKMVEECWSNDLLVPYCDLLKTLSQIVKESAGIYDDLITDEVDQLRIS